MPEPELGSELHIEVHGDWGEATEDYLEGCGLLGKVWREDPEPGVGLHPVQPQPVIQQENVDQHLLLRVDLQQSRAAPPHLTPQHLGSNV